MTVWQRCFGKKTALLQTSVVCRLVRFANVLFCALAVSIFLFCLYVANCPLCRCLLHLAVTTKYHQIYTTFSNISLLSFTLLPDLVGFASNAKSTAPPSTRPFSQSPPQLFACSQPGHIRISRENCVRRQKYSDKAIP